MPNITCLENRSLQTLGCTANRDKRLAIAQRGGYPWLPIACAPLPRNRTLLRRSLEILHRRPELLLVLAFGLVAAVTLAVIAFAAEIAEGETLAVDRAILHGLRAALDGMTGHPETVRRLMTDMTALGGGTVLTLVVVLACGLLVSVRRHATAAILAVQVIAGTGLVAWAKTLFGRDRPDVIAHFVSVNSLSFPSGHAANSAIVYLSIAVLLATAAPQRSARIYILCVAVALSVVIGLSRLYLGVHWPSDVLAGWAIGASWALAVGLITRWSRRHGLPR